jgi:rubrerythrin
MPDFKKISDILEVAIRIERQGIEFYNKLHDTVDSTDAKETFSYLAAEEEKHIGWFREILSKVAEDKPKYKYPGEYELFLEGAANYALNFFQKGKTASAAKNTSESIEIGIGLEIASVAYYTQFSQGFAKTEKQIIEKVIKEEKSHLAKLQLMKRKLTK